MAKGGKICRGPSHDKPTRLPASAFAKDRLQKDGLQVRCKECQALHRRQRADAREALEVEIDRSGKTCRKNWPQDEAERNALISEYLKTSLLENEGDLVEVSECLNRPIHELMDLIEASDELQRIWERGLQVRAIRAESALYKNVASGKSSDVKTALTNLAPERWSDRTRVDVVGYQPVSGDLCSVLSIVQGEKKDA